MQRLQHEHALYSAGAQFESRPGHVHRFRIFAVFLPQVEYWNITAIRSRRLPYKFFSVPQSCSHPMLHNVHTETVVK
jgi:hypothetical protein